VMFSMTFGNATVTETRVQRSLTQYCQIEIFLTADGRR
jgi:hypothetical protein